MAAVLDSGIFHRAPSLAQLLNYICEKYFEGEANQIKEYNIAVEALHRSSEFDQKKDSIVRVEAHRLRKRLKEYYEGAGADHPIRIEIPSGQYAPRFVPRPSMEVAAVSEPVPAPEAPSMVPEPAPIEFAPVKPPRRKRIVVAFGLAAALTGVVALIPRVNFRGQERVVAAAAADPEIPADEIRIAAGSPVPVKDRMGRVWEADRWFHGGNVMESPQHPIYGTRDAKLYRTRRDGEFRYEIPLKRGVYELRLHFAEIVYGEENLAGSGETSRLFSILANGKSLADGFDPIADGGPSRAQVRVFKDIEPDEHGKLTLQFVPSVSSAFVNAIEITPGLAGRIRPIRIVARDQPYIDHRGQVWLPDQYFHGGQHVRRSNMVTGTKDPELYRGEHYGNITYEIPVAKGRYGLVLHFAETWFGPGKRAGGGAGSGASTSL